MITTSRLFIRPWQLADAEELVSLRSEEGLNNFSSGRYSNLTLEGAKDLIASEAKHFAESGLSRYGIFLAESGPMIGICGLFKMNEEPFKDRVGMNYRFPRKYWGHGYGPEAAHAVLYNGLLKLQLPEVSALIDEANTRSSRVAEKIGMTFMGPVVFRNQTHQHWITRR